ncbi:MAG: hypothetical protein HRU70_15105 [Phycisphaeraceae bacterium]|nr:MAG: hypothetical protein HRU70_15105 [Phycisphaeraceae bacterium]
MKYAAVIMDGAPDDPFDPPEGPSPLALAQPAFSPLLTNARVGRAIPFHDPGEPSRAGALAAILATPPALVLQAHLALEALGSNLHPGPNWLAALDFITADAPAGDARTDLLPAERATLARDLLAHARARIPDAVDGLDLLETPQGLRLIDRSSRAYAGVITTPPDDLDPASLKRALPGGGDPAGSETLRAIVETSRDVLRSHDINAARAANNLPTADLAWPYAPSVVPRLPPLPERLGLSITLLTRDPLVRGLARALAIHTADAPADHADLARIAADALGSFDLVIVHDPSPYLAPRDTRHEALTSSAQRLLPPIVDRLTSFGDPESDAQARGWRLLVVAGPSHAHEPPDPQPSPMPFFMRGAWVRAVVQRPFTEDDALESDLAADPAHELLEYFLKGGLARVKAPARRSKDLLIPLPSPKPRAPRKPRRPAR